MCVSLAPFGLCPPAETSGWDERRRRCVTDFRPTKNQLRQVLQVRYIVCSAVQYGLAVILAGRQSKERIRLRPLTAVSSAFPSCAASAAVRGSTSASNVGVVAFAQRRTFVGIYRARKTRLIKLSVDSYSVELSAHLGDHYLHPISSHKIPQIRWTWTLTSGLV